MISEDRLAEMLEQILGQAPAKRVPVRLLADELALAEQSNNTRLSEYGYIMFALERIGVAGVYRNQLSSGQLVKEYAETARRYKEDMSTQLMNASKYVTSVFNTMQDPDMCFPKLEGMSYPYVLYVLFASQGHGDMVECWKKEATEHYRRYPGTVDNLPDNYKNVVEELLNDADTEQY